MMVISAEAFARRTFRDHPRFHFAGIQDLSVADVAALVDESGFGDVIGWYRDDAARDESWMIVLERGFIVPLHGKPTSIAYADLLDVTAVESKPKVCTLRIVTTQDTVDAAISGHRGKFRDIYNVWKFLRYMIPSRIPPTVTGLS